MRLFMFIMDVFFAIAWTVMGIMAFCGYVMPPVTVGCGLLLAGLYNVREALDDFARWKGWL